MSVVPNLQLKAVESDDIPTFPIEEVMGTSPYTKDFFSDHLAFWKSLVIRNLQPTFNCTYQLMPNGPAKRLNPLSERPIKGWGSFFSVTTADPSPDIEIDYIGVYKKDAWK